jgi:hypothetical protein
VLVGRGGTRVLLLGAQHEPGERRPVARELLDDDAREIVGQCVRIAGGLE